MVNKAYTQKASHAQTSLACARKTSQMLDSGSSRFQHFSHKMIRRHQSGGQPNVAPAWLNTAIKAPHHSAQMVYQEFVRVEQVELL
jgi:hypothetical protein